MTEDGTARAIASAHDAAAVTVNHASVAELEAAIGPARVREAGAALDLRVAGAEKKLKRAKAEVLMHERELRDARQARAAARREETV